MAFLSLKFFLGSVIVLVWAIATLIHSHKLLEATTRRVFYKPARGRHDSGMAAAAGSSSSSSLTVRFETLMLDEILEKESATRNSSVRHNIPLRADPSSAATLRALSSSSVSVPAEEVVAPEDSFGACLILKDDNHWLVEWLAYHYFALPLRHLVVYVNPESRTSPGHILERWRNRIDVKVWNDDHLPYGDSKRIPDKYRVRTLQNRFLGDCMRWYADNQQESGVPSWIALTDLDEFLGINDWARNRTYQTIFRDNIPPNDEAGSVMTFLRLHQQPPKRNNVTAAMSPLFRDHPNCIPVQRQQICYDEAGEAQLGGGSSSGIEGPFSRLGIKPSDFMTHNFPWIASDRSHKVLVNVGSIPRRDLDDIGHKGEWLVVHNPVPLHCPRVPYIRMNRAKNRESKLKRERSLFVAFHYPGTVDQRSFRDDVRGGYLTRIGTSPPPEKCKRDKPATDLKPWLQGFVRQVGIDEASRLLEGVGRTDIWPPG